MILVGKPGDGVINVLTNFSNCPSVCDLGFLWVSDGMMIERLGAGGHGRSADLAVMTAWNVRRGELLQLDLVCVPPTG
ncbi:hypothetical protein RRG08_039216 [Elysia crispata]|uniref:Uncharacterized protein n=1 Tax=Elysia crispata TaxID=231223 RepID=A0AAE1E4N8_9GAST|nr:hypothetical protein RRG08_039216 [Elysia crispata]